MDVYSRINGHVGRNEINPARPLSLRLFIKCMQREKCPQTSSSSGSASSASAVLRVVTALCQARRKVRLLNLTPCRAAYRWTNRRAEGENTWLEEKEIMKCKKGASRIMKIRESNVQCNSLSLLESQETQERNSRISVCMADSWLTCSASALVL